MNPTNNQLGTLKHTQQKKNMVIKNQILFNVYLRLFEFTNIKNVISFICN